ncbi:MAG: helix-turn-helix transcriptional regulator, partial [Patescibacteria group bacterium]|nr:helix-turn-helix transcriptional regulator [Patescibacteria group bacterium]
MWKVPGMCVSDLSKEIGESVAVVSHHLRALAKVGLLTPVRDGKKVCYRYVDKGIAKEMKDL